MPACAVGQHWDRADWTTNGFNIAGIPSPPFSADTGASFGAEPARFGGYFGYNYQIDSNWLVGLEADIGAAAGSSRSLVGIPDTGIGFATPAGANLSQTTVEMPWDGSLGVRAGYLIAPNVLLYGTGGVAFQEIKETIFARARTRRRPAAAPRALPT